MVGMSFFLPGEDDSLGQFEREPEARPAKVVALDFLARHDAGPESRGNLGEKVFTAAFAKATPGRQVHPMLHALPGPAFDEIDQGVSRWRDPRA